MAGKIKDYLRRAKERWAGLELIVREVLSLAALIALALLYTLTYVPSGCSDEVWGEAHWVCDLFGVDQKYEAIHMLGWGLAGAIAICALVIGNRRAIKAAEAGHRQQRFSDGVNHLGNDKESVRQGGAHALFHLALDNQKLRASIAGILCAHVRAITGDNQYQTSHKDKPSTEVQSLLNLLFTIKTQSAKTMDAFWERLVPDLSGGYFRGAELPSARFQRARLEGAQFQGARLFHAQFQGAWLPSAQFHGADLDYAQFQGALLFNAQFQGADLDYAQFQGADLDYAQFQGAKLRWAQFQGAWLHGAEFQGAEMDDGTDFAGTYSANMQQNQRFESRIRDGIDKDADFSQVCFTGNMDDKRIEKEVEKFRQVPKVTKDDIRAFEKALRDHVDSDTPENRQRQLDIETRHKDRKYTKEQAELWIEEYQKAIASAP